MTFTMYLQSLGWEFVLSITVITICLTVYGSIALLNWLFDQFKRMVN